jgi:hypothetical protein
LTFVALAAPIKVWAIGGLEQPLYGALLAWSLTSMYVLMATPVTRADVAIRPALWASFAYGLLCLTRPDGPIFPAIGAGVLVLTGFSIGWRRSIKTAALVLVFPIAFSLAQLLFRLTYYGEWVPNTALVKIAPSSVHWQFGVEYLTDGFRALSPWTEVIAVALVALIVVPRTRYRGLLLATTAVAWTGYVAVIGGDIFPAYRHFIPLIVVGAFTIAEAASLVATRLAHRPLWLAPVVLVSGLAFSPYVNGQRDDKWIKRAMTERWEWQGKEVALLLKNSFWQQQPTMAVTAAGCLPYWSELPALDMMGLNDYYLPRHRPAGFGTGMVGHELGDGAYVLSQRPDLIVFDVGSPGPSWRTGEQLSAMPEFTERYVPVTAMTSPINYTAVIFIDKYSTRIGIARSAEALTVPAYLAIGPDAVAILRDGALTLRITGARPASVTFRAAADVRWTIDERLLASSGIEGRVTQQGEMVSVSLRSTRAEPVEIQRFVLTPAAAPRPLAGAPAASFAKARARPLP